jgi:hypothetical protein
VIHTPPAQVKKQLVIIDKGLITSSVQQSGNVATSFFDAFSSLAA